MLYRIFTERKNVKTICQFVSDYFDGFTIFNTIGYWQGKKEKSICIEIVSDKPSDLHWIKRIIQSINGYNKQDCCLLQIVQIESVLI